MIAGVYFLLKQDDEKEEFNIGFTGCCFDLGM